MFGSFFSKNTHKRRIYLDHAAATPLDPRVKASMEPYWSRVYGNPGSIHREGVAAHRAVEGARARVAACLGALPDEIIFTSGGTEANHLAIHGMMYDAAREVGLVVSAIEHPSILESARALELSGKTVHYLSVDGEGCIEMNELTEVLGTHSRLVSVMYVSNEIGTVQPLKEIAKVIRKVRKHKTIAEPFFHTDASQAPLYLPMDVRKLGVDLMTLDGQKIYGPKGIGILYRRRGVPLASVMYGGEQEFGLRPGTENVPLIIGIAKALELACEEREEKHKRLFKIQTHFLESLKRELPHAVVNGSVTNRVPNNVNISLPGVDSEFAVLWLDAHGIACGSRSACSSKVHDTSYVLQAMGVSQERASSTLRFSFGRGTRARDVDATIHALKSIPQSLTRDK